MPKLVPPKTLTERLVATSIPADIAIAILSFILVVVGVSQKFGDGKNPPTALFIWGLITIGVLQLIASLYKVFVQYQKEINEEGVHSLQGCLHTLHAMLLATVPDGTRHGLRMTIHLPTSKGDELIQLFEYVGERRGTRTAGRRFPVQCGIVGQAFRARQQHVGKRSNIDYEDFVKEMIDEWNFSDADARKLNPASKAWVATPLLADSSQPPKAVVFLDSTDSEFFDDPKRLEIIESACQGIARFIEQ
jgi:hypothetical protein